MSLKVTTYLFIQSIIILVKRVEHVQQNQNSIMSNNQSLLQVLILNNF